MSATIPDIFEPTDSIATTGVGAPSYTSGTHRLNGSAAILKLKPARMRKNPAFDPSSQDMLLAAGAGLGVAVAAGVLLGAVVATLARVPYGYMFGVLAGQAAAGWAIGETVYRVSRHKRSRGLSYVAAISAFVAYVAAKAVSHALGVNGIVDLWELLGLGASVYIAMGRLRP